MSHQTLGCDFKTMETMDTILLNYCTITSRSYIKWHYLLDRNILFSRLYFAYLPQIILYVNTTVRFFIFIFF